MPLMEVTLQQTFFNQECVNRWNYIAAGTPAAVTFSFAMADALGAVATATVYPADRLMRLIAAIQSAGVSFIQLTIKDVYSVTDFYTQPFIDPLIGAVSGDSGSPAMAYGFFSNRVRSDIRQATKRFVGVAESGLSSGGLLGAGTLTAAGTLAAEMSAVQTYDDEGNTLSFSPCVVSKQRYDPETGLPDPEGTAYRYYPTEAEQLTHIAQGILWDVYPQVRTQASRQYGHGR